jgi:WD40 repeat protein
MKKILVLLPAFVFAFYSCGDKPAEAVKADTVDSAAVKTPAAKPVEIGDPNDSVFLLKKTITLPGNPALYSFIINSFNVMPNGNIIYTSFGDDSIVRIITPEGKLVRAFGVNGHSESTFRDYPSFLTLAPNGNIYIEDGAQSKVKVFDSLGNFKYQIAIEGGRDVLVGGMAINSKGELLVSLSGELMIKKYDSDGKFIGDIKSISKRGGVAWGNFEEVAVDNSDAIYVRNSRSTDADVVVHELDKDGNYLSTIPLRLDLGFGVFTVDQYGRIFSNFSGGVKAYTHEGRKIATIEHKSSDSNRVRGIKVDKAGNVYLLCNDNQLKIYQ